MVKAAGLGFPIVESSVYAPAAEGLVTIETAAGATVLAHLDESGFWPVSQVLGMDEAKLSGRGPSRRRLSG